MELFSKQTLKTTVATHAHKPKTQLLGFVISRIAEVHLNISNNVSGRGNKRNKRAIRA